MAWLVGDPTDPADPLRAARFHQACAPDGPFGEIACPGCGDGPLLVGPLAHPVDLPTAAALDDWLIVAGWQLVISGRAGPWCPDCLPTPDRSASSAGWR